MSAREFLDCDGDTWTEFEPGQLRLTKRSNGSTLCLGTADSVESVRDEHGPLTEIRPDVDARALLAGAFEDLSEWMSAYIPSGAPLKDVQPYIRLADAAEHIAASLREGE
ncbi:hypothetical protein OG709_30060 [Streptomyces sp. NBC_01267]|uniref:hypothetical protein n=1 Tax=Streptomyces sp. NBC_01267 TaxID=2903805 RepID=UPI002E3418A6|nr:hypothetical protein [Streptomyces sp. NBC_01267]